MDQSYTVKINRAEGIVEITGTDKDWIAAQLDKLAPVYSGSGPAPRRSTPNVKEPGATPAESKPRPRRGTGDRAQRKPELEAKLTPEVKKTLQEYVDARSGHWKPQTNQVAIIATFLLDELGWDTVDEDDIYTVYVTMGWPSPGKPRSTLENARGRNGYFGPWSDGKLHLSHKGENFGRSIPTPKT